MDMNRSAIYDFLLTFRSNTGQSRAVSDIKSLNFPTQHVLTSPAEGTFVWNSVTALGLKNIMMYNDAETIPKKCDDIFRRLDKIHVRDGQTVCNCAVT